MNEFIKIIITDDHKLFADAITKTLQCETNLFVIGTAYNGEELLDLLPHKTPDIILLDVEMPVMDGRKTLDIIQKRFPSVKVIIISMHFSETLMKEFIDKGASGFVPKGEGIEILVQAINLVHETGDCFKLSETITSAIDNRSKNFLQKHYNLSKRELEVLRLICMGKLNKEVSAILNIVERTVEFHKKNIHVKTGLLTQAELVLFAAKHELL
ncbi:MAG: response regulator transcription factor [Bacteroidia bacterium]